MADDMLVNDDLVEMVRETARKFLAEEVLPHKDAWRAAGQVARSVWFKAGEAGLLGAGIPEEFGGAGGDFRHEAAIYSELGRADFVDFGIGVHSGIVLPYFLHLGTERQKADWLPKLCSGEAIAAVAMTEPGTGSDLRSIATKAVRDGDEYVLNGQKTFISNGILADVVIVAARTGDTGLSLFIVEKDRPGFSVGRAIKKIGLEGQDTAELYMSDVRIPAENLLGGEEGVGMKQLKTMLPQERLVIAIQGLGSLETAIRLTVDYAKDRKAFGAPLMDLGTIRAVLAEVETEADLARVYLDYCVLRLLRGDLDVATAAKAKWWVTDRQVSIIDRCLQIFGGYGYTTEYPISQLYLNARAQTIYGGTTEVMKEIVARSL